MAKRNSTGLVADSKIGPISIFIGKHWVSVVIIKMGNYVGAVFSLVGV